MDILYGTRTIDAKYHIEIRDRGGNVLVPVIVNTKTGKMLPEDEPLILFRGQDMLVRSLMTHYADLCLTSGSPRDQLNLIRDTHIKFDRFAEEHPERIKVPD